MFATYLIEETLSGSRGAVLMLPIMLICGKAFEGFDSKRSQVWRMTKIFSIFAPFIFIFATGMRTNVTEMDLASFLNLMVGRVSGLELAMIPIYNIGSPDVDWTLFYEKYGFANQIKGIINSISLFKPFEFDILPNGYFPAIFLGMTEDYVRTYYSSTPLTLPVFLFLYFGPLCFLLFGGIILMHYFVAKWCVRFPFLCVVVVLQIYPLLIFFDWVWLFKVSYSYALTCFVLVCYLLFLKNTKRRGASVKP